MPAQTTIPCDVYVEPKTPINASVSFTVKEPMESRQGFEPGEWRATFSCDTSKALLIGDRVTLRTLSQNVGLAHVRDVRPAGNKMLVELVGNGAPPAETIDTISQS